MAHSTYGKQQKGDAFIPYKLSDFGHISLLTAQQPQHISMTMPPKKKKKKKHHKNQAATK